MFLRSSCESECLKREIEALKRNHCSTHVCQADLKIQGLIQFRTDRAGFGPKQQSDVQHVTVIRFGDLVVQTVDEEFAADAKRGLVYLHHAPAGILQVKSYGNVYDEVVFQPNSTEGTDGAVPSEVGAGPVISFQNRPTSQLYYQLV